MEGVSEQKRSMEEDALQKRKGIYRLFYRIIDDFIEDRYASLPILDVISVCMIPINNSQEVAPTM